MDRRDVGEGTHRREGISGEGVQMIVDGEAPVIVCSEDDADSVRKRMTSSNVWSATTNASCGESEGRLEAGGCIGALQAMVRRSFWGSLRQTKGEDMRTEEGKGEEQRMSGGAT
jgi:hypothetical protein